MDAQAEALESVVIRKIAWRILPIILASYCVSFVDRSNIAVAALTMNKDLGFSALVYGLGAGVFFIGYFLFEIPSNLILQRVGPRLWIARIMFTWGVVSAAGAFVTGPRSFITLRFLLGVAEAGFVPGAILYFTYWFPDRYRARILAAFFVAIPVANTLSNLLSVTILQLDGVLGFRGWQWIFLIEAVPAVILSVVVLRTTIDRPGQAGWLEPNELQWLEKALVDERVSIESRKRLTSGDALLDWRVFVLSAIWMLSLTAGYGTTFFMPQILKNLGLSNVTASVASAIPYVVGIVGLLAWGWSSDRANERRWHLIAGAVLSGIGLVAAGMTGSAFWALAAMSVAVVGSYGVKCSLWPMPSLFLTGPGAAAGIALINSIGNLGGYIGPFAVGWIKDSTNSFELALYFLAVCSFAAAATAFLAERACVAPATAPAE